MLAIRDSLTAPLPPWCRRHQSGGRSAGGSPHAAPLRQWAASRVGKQTCLRVRVLVSRLACGNRARLAQASVRVRRRPGLGDRPECCRTRAGWAGSSKPSEKDQMYKGGSWGDNARYGQGRKELEKETRITQWNEVGDTRVGYGCCGGNKQQGVKIWQRTLTVCRDCRFRP